MTAPGGYAVAFNEVNGMAYSIDHLRDGLCHRWRERHRHSGRTGPHKLAVNQTTGTVYIANLYGNSVTVINGTTVSATIGLGGSPMRSPRTMGAMQSSSPSEANRASP